ncbi:copper amine oxidase N-terminal domain-containing protein [Cytobacillus depressus]|uniref:Copper amine oxidase N-terminal domain-containing protein n=1 Tax=Cytobacillus depressus TaxID=1602942 RepID=A0A6L3VC48_9BACI|nr:stalk domain-containing protein [Cytobacillus depressus]KAB2336763.1 copper amine oxidase N-terminal domain-containing protein [Cytobacillus depressus]
MKVLRVVTSIVLASLLFTSHLEASASALVGKGLYIKSNVTIEINGKNIKIKDPILNKSDHLLLPMRDLYEAIGANVSWDTKSKTASAVKNGKTVALKVNSLVAQVNGKNISMNVAPLLYRDRTYMPLRFVSENFDGIVQWNQAKQKVEITLNDSIGTPTPSEANYVLHMNNKRIIMADPVMVKQGRTYIPADYFYEHLENASGTWGSNQEFELQIAGLNFIFANGKNTVLVNQEPVQIDEVPFLQSGKMYVPVHFIVNALGGNLRMLADKKEMYIYLSQYMFKSDFIEKSFGATPRPELVPSATLEGNRNLLVSDNPETLTPSLIPNSTATLAQHPVTSAAETNEHRVFGWHLNKLGQKVTIGVTIQNTSKSNSIQIMNAKGYAKKSGNSWLNYDIGLPIADAVLNESLQDLESKGIVIQPGETKIIENYELHPGYTVGFLQDLDIRSLNGGESSYTIRTVLAKNNENLTLIQSEPVAIDKLAAHPRGVWPHSTISATFPANTVGSAQVGYNISNDKTDHLLTAQNSLSMINGSVGNPGHFGMVYKVNIPIVNPTWESKTVRLKMAGRGGLYNGAVKMNGQVYLIPTLKPGTEYVELPDFKMNEQTATIQLEVMHAGGASLPVAIYVETR